MTKKDDDLVQEIFGKSAKDVISTEPNSFKSIYMRELNPDDDNKGLFISLRVASLEEASVKAKLFTAKLKEYSQVTNDESHISLYSDGLNIILYGSSKKEFTEVDWEMARELEAVLSSEQL